MSAFRTIASLMALVGAGACFAQPARDGLPPPLRIAIARGAALSYAGTRIVEFKVGSEVRRHVEHVWRDGERTRIEFPPDSDYAGQVIVEQGDRRRHFLPESNEILILPARREEAFERLRALGQLIRQGAVRFVARDGGQIAGFRCELIGITDPAGNPIQRLWIDRRSGMILKREMYDRVGTRVGYFEFTRVQLNPRFRPNEFQIVHRGAEEVTPQQQLRKLGRQVGFAAPVIPESEGYELESARVLKVAGEPVLVQSYLGRNGRLSLFALKGRLDPERLRRLAGGNFGVHIWAQGDVSLALVGDVPVPQLAALARRMNR